MKNYLLHLITVNWVVLLAVLLILTSLSAHSQSIDGDWGPPTQAGEYTLYSRFPEGSSIKQVKMTGIIHANMDAVVYALGAVEEYPQWIYNCLVAERVSTKSPEDFSYYLLIDFPFPLSDRDLEVDAHHYVDGDGVWRGRTVAPLHPKRKPKEGVVRITYYQVTWALRYLSPHDTHFEYTISMDPGGYIPTFVTNQFLNEAPVKTIKALEKQSRKIEGLK